MKPFSMIFNACLQICLQECANKKKKKEKSVVINLSQIYGYRSGTDFMT